MIYFPGKGIDNLKTTSTLLLLLAFLIGPSAAQGAADLNRSQRSLLENRIALGSTPAPDLIKKIGSRLTVHPTTSGLGGGYWSETLITSGPSRYRVFIHRDSLSRNRSGAEILWDRHMIWHELGHVITSAYFTLPLYNRAFTLFRKSSFWQDCFFDPTSGDCVPEDEILADQLAFWITGSFTVRSPRNIPPLFSRQELKTQVMLPLAKRNPR